MSAQKTNRTGRPFPLVVGTIYSPGSFQRALGLPAGAVDLLELRVDHFADDPEALLRAASRLPAPLIVTVRHPQEGGANALSPARRVELFQQFLPVAAYVDVELRSITRFAGLLATLRREKRRLIVSDHHFRRLPPTPTLRERWQLARAAGAEIVKVAAQTETQADLERLGALLELGEPGRISVMGMGPLGKVSRLLFARLGSALNYGYLDEPQVPGQWEATLLKERVRELFEE